MNEEPRIKVIKCLCIIYFALISWSYLLEKYSLLLKRVEQMWNKCLYNVLGLKMLLQNLFVFTLGLKT